MRWNPALGGAPQVARGVARAAFVVVAVFSARSRAGNDEGLFLGNQAAMAGGAVTSTVSDGSAIWYNPAGLSAVPAQSVDVSGSAYGIRHYSARSFLSSANGETAPVRVTELVVVPTALAYVRPLGSDVRLGLGLFAPKANDLVLRGNLRAGADGRWILTEANYDRTTFGGASLAFPVRPDLRVGASLLGSYRYEQTELQFAGGVPGTDPAQVAFSSSSAVQTRTTLGGLLSLGVQWDVTPVWTVGLSLRSPSFNLFTSDERQTFVTGFSNTNGATSPVYLPRSDTKNRSSFDLTEPPQLRVGVSRHWDHGWVALDGDISTGLSEASETVRNAKFNVRAGGMQRIADQMSVGLGLFTDRDSTARTGTNGPINFYGGSVGLRWGKVYKVEDAEGPKTFDFTTTLALRYAYGHGDTTALRVAMETVDGGPQPTTGTAPTTLTVHEFMLHLGSGFYF